MKTFSKSYKISALLLAIVLCVSLVGCNLHPIQNAPISELEEQMQQTLPQTDTDAADIEDSIDISEIPPYSGSPYIEINGNMPTFSTDEYTVEPFETYSELDELGRCGVAYANICQELMPTEERGEIGQIKPSGWHTVRYDDIVDGKYLYNRCHLIGFQLAGENANERNLITGTRYMNVDGMLPFENMVADYVEETDNHVLYRVTPIYDGDNLVANGVQMEAYSVEDGGDGVCYNIYVYNVQPGIEIDYATGESWIDGEEVPADIDDEQFEFTYVINIKSGKFHDPGCSGVATMSDKNKQIYVGTRDDLLEMGYEPCGQCHP